MRHRRWSHGARRWSRWRPVARQLLGAALLALPLVAAPALTRAAQTVAVAPFEFVQSADLISGGQPNAAERRRLARARAAMRHWLDEKQPALHTLRDAAARQRLATGAAAVHLRSCHACAVDLAREAGADAIVLGWVQKVSELILNLNVVVLDSRSGAPIVGRSVDMRGNTDVSWERATDHLLDPALGAALDEWATSGVTPTRSSR